MTTVCQWHPWPQAGGQPHPRPRPSPHLAEVVPFGPICDPWPEAEEVQLCRQDLLILGHAGEDKQEPHLLAVSWREGGV